MEADRNGFILITTLIVLAILAAFSLGLSQQIRLHLSMEQFHQDAATATRLMDDGVVYAAHTLGSGANRNYPYRFEAVDPALLGLSQNERLEVWTVELGGLLNINATPQEVVEEVLRQIVDSPNEAEEIAAAIADWRDADSSGLAEEIHYGNLQLPYAPRNGPMRRVEELSLVSGVTTFIYQGEDTNHNYVLDPSEDDGDVAAPVDNQDGVLQLGLRDYFCVREEEAVNINSAPAHVWLAIFRWALGEEKYRAPALAASISAFRAGPDGLLGTLDDQQFSDPEEWKQALGAGNDETIQRIDGVFTFSIDPVAYVVNVRAVLDEERIARSCRAWFVLADGRPKIHRYEVMP